MTLDNEKPPSPTPVLFRASKKRKAGLRQRATSPDDAAPTAIELNPKAATSSASNFPPSIEHDETEDAKLSALRHRARKRLNGVGFSASRSTPTDDLQDPSSSRALIPHSSATSQDPEQPIVGKRFAPQTGLTTTVVDKHMMEYIESRLSNRKSSQPPSQITSPSRPHPYGGGASSSRSQPHEPQPKNQPIMQGKLMEVDLGDEVRARNQAMTELAARRLLGEPVPPPEEEQTGRRAKKPRLGRDGKPWRPRNRRNSDDIKRDQLVEEILRENKLDVYDVPAAQPEQRDGDGDADDRLAEEFRREFMDAMVQRQQKKKAAAPPARAGARKPDEDVLRGPKLGGSRNSRAAMRDLLLKKEKETKR
ncbi:hypothetical protein Cob_v005111 [Colletotrichum orbiculare MAFF 240422]|uniref:Uncharacterized protein n=1 Tax=Colletotrichum orbiculare (strain 104-T / ATCC 96160 / CBS 514.97 / LARS 414 / MAFF 240422) TaxID=1213857 RepID=N4UMN3_COLOR|nr:hypothetical protein Cob_v005111 [Colletotrichum orbiculare MAFF 240422]